MEGIYVLHLGYIANVPGLIPGCAAELGPGFLLVDLWWQREYAPGRKKTFRDGGAPLAESVLIIDNDPQVREFLCATLGSSGYAAAGVSSYPEAMARLTKHPVDLAVTDGFTALGLAGVSDAPRLFPSLRMVVMSGSVSDYATVPLASRLLLILPKPCPVPLILSVVNSVFGRTTVDPLQDIFDRGRFDVLTTVALSQDRATQGTAGRSVKARS